MLRLLYGFEIGTIDSSIPHKVFEDGQPSEVRLAALGLLLALGLGIYFWRKRRKK